MIPVLIFFAGIFLCGTFNSVIADGICNDDNEDIVLLPPNPPPNPIPAPFNQPKYSRLYMTIPLQRDEDGNYDGIEIPDHINICSCVSFLQETGKNCGSSFIRNIPQGGYEVLVSSLNNYVSDEMSSTAESIKRFDKVPTATRRIIMRGQIEKLIDYVAHNNFYEAEYEGGNIPEILRINQSQVNCSFFRTDNYYISMTDNKKFGWAFVSEDIVIKTPGSVGIPPPIHNQIMSSLDYLGIKDRMVRVELYGEYGGRKLEKEMFSKIEV